MNTIEQTGDRAGLKEAERLLAAALDQELAAARGALREIFSGSELREAMVWQNRRAAEVVLGHFPKDTGPPNSAARQRLRTLTNYLQRYTTKNDTIGFFGPLAFASLTERGPPLQIRWGARRLARREVFFEIWAIAALAERWSQLPGIRAALAPRLSPGLRLEGTRLVHLASGRERELPADYAQILALADGRRSAGSIALEIARASDDQLDPEEVSELLEELAEQGALLWALEVEVPDNRPERALRAKLQALAPSPDRDRALAALGDLEAHLEQVRGAAGDPDRLATALAALELTFQRQAELPAERRAGETYGARTICYEDTIRDLDVALGPQIWSGVSAPLSMVLDSARWVTSRIAAGALAAAGEVYRQLRRDLGEVPLARVLDALHDRLVGGGLVDQTYRELQLRWEALIGWSPGDRSVVRRSADLSARAAQAFACEGPGWPSARHHSPDLLIAADRAAGSLLFVLGEAHLTTNAMFAANFLELNPDPEALYRQVAREIPQTALVFVPALRDMLRANARPSRRDHVAVEVSSTRSSSPRDRVVPIAELVVVDDGGHLRVRSRDGRIDLPIIAALESRLDLMIFDRFKLFPPHPHLPRIRIDDLVIARESWILEGPPSFAHQADTLRRFLEAGRWQRALDLPRFTFVRVSGETKPVFLDLESPLLVDLVAHLWRRSNRSLISEMLPAFDQLVLEDETGQRFTSEVRLQAVDRR